MKAIHLGEEMAQNNGTAALFMEEAIHKIDMASRRARSLELTDENRKQALDILWTAGLAGQTPLLGVHAGGDSKAKSLLPGLVAKTLDHWQARHHGRILLIGEKEEQSRMDEIREGLRLPRAAVNLAGLPLPVAAACLEQVDLFLSPDTRLLHRAAAVGTPTVSVFHGPSSPWKNAPRGAHHLIIHSALPCAPCSSPGECSVGRFCKSLVTPAAIAGVLDLAHGLIRLKAGHAKDALLKEWKEWRAHEYAGRKTRVLYTGWRTNVQQGEIEDLTAPSPASTAGQGKKADQAGSPRLSYPRKSA